MQFIKNKYNDLVKFSTTTPTLQYTTLQVHLHHITHTTLHYNTFNYIQLHYTTL